MYFEYSPVAPVLVQPRSRYIQRTLTLDDYLQLQALLRHEEAERERQLREQAAMEQARQERLRLQQAMNNLRLLTSHYRRERAREIERCLAERRRREHQQSILRAIQQKEEERERMYRQYLAAAIERKRIDDLYHQYLKAREQEEQQPPSTANSAWVQYPEEEEEEEEESGPDTADGFDDYHAQKLASLVNLIFGQQQEDEHEESPVQQKQESQRATKDDDYRDNWDDLMRYVAEDDKHTKLLDESKAVPSTVEKARESQAPVALKQVNHSETQPATDESAADMDSDTESQKSGSSTDSVAEDYLPLDKHILTVKDLVDHLATIPPKEPSPPQPVSDEEYEPTPEQDAVMDDHLNMEEPHEDIAMKEQSDVPPTVNDPVKQAKKDTLLQLEAQLRMIQEQHEATVLGSQLEFQQTEPNKLVLTASTSNNREFLGYEDEIVRVMLKLDTVESDGDEEIRQERKSLVKRAESLLEKLDEHKQSEWQRAKNLEHSRKRKNKNKHKKRNKHKQKHHHVHLMQLA
ncbi:uncharacterized protein BYT42DRAFT_549438 [Radiomyces spectabilis]|uniref:uncharacterized protein n=1 Tax=Radiomyces spectabilis TaxID=64574 RepID=UPI00221F9400|nr:uncharacterized protein BYT42DRAFT_549438 [Radiomyces spectabilis]KAI8368256.1 hypothetical protein BYT42DRAFT_549438 [Radiomyces spectabilis]